MASAPLVATAASPANKCRCWRVMRSVATGVPRSAFQRPCPGAEQQRPPSSPGTRLTPNGSPPLTSSPWFRLGTATGPPGHLVGLTEVADSAADGFGVWSQESGSGAGSTSGAVVRTSRRHRDARASSVMSRWIALTADSAAARRGDAGNNVTVLAR
jgi:hypothetical protein